MAPRSLAKDALRVLLDLTARLTRHFPRRQTARILNYHEVLAGDRRPSNPYNQVNASALAEHVEALQQAGFSFVTVSELARRMVGGVSGSGRLVALTFDDGLEEHVSTVLPILTKRGVTATFYVLPGRTAQPTQLGRAEGRHLDEKEIRSLARAGMEVGSHSWSHPVLSRLSPDRIQQEVGASRTELARILGAVPTTFAYPYGSRSTYDERVIEAVRRAGYRNAVCTTVGPNDPSTPLFEMRRIPVYGGDSPSLVVARALGAYDWVGRVQGLWLKLFPHHSTRRAAE